MQGDFDGSFDRVGGVDRVLDVFGLGNNVPSGPHAERSGVGHKRITVDGHIVAVLPDVAGAVAIRPRHGGVVVASVGGAHIDVGGVIAFGADVDGGRAVVVVDAKVVLARAIDGRAVVLARQGGVTIDAFIDPRGLLPERGIVHAFFPESAPAEITATKITTAAATAPGEESVRRNKQGADQNQR